MNIRDCDLRDDRAIENVVRLIARDYPIDEFVSADLAIKLASSGETLALAVAPTVDLASTGGPSSLSTLLVPLFYSHAGCVVPKLGVPGRPAGGIDCLAQIPGYQTHLTAIEAIKAVRIAGYAHFLADESFAPLDARMFSIRKRHGLLNVPTLVAASILAKKKSVAVSYAGLEIRCFPGGNFGDDINESTRNGEFFCRVARRLGISGSFVVTHGTRPYQPYIGRGESIIALHELLYGEPCKWLIGHLELCKEMAIASVPPDYSTAIQRAGPSQLAGAFERNLIAQGGSVSQFKMVAKLKKSKHIYGVRAAKRGVFHCELTEVRRVLSEAQNLFGQLVHVEFPDPVGIIINRNPGEMIDAGDLLASVRIEDLSAAPILDDLAAHALYAAN